MNLLHLAMLRTISTNLKNSKSIIKYGSRNKRFHFRGLSCGITNTKPNIMISPSLCLDNFYSVKSTAMKSKPYGSPPMRYFSAMTDTQSDNVMTSKNLMENLANMAEELGEHFEFPKVVVVGNQSSGKSSVLEAIVGFPILPKGSNMVTRRPLELTLIRDVSMSVGFKAQFGATGRVLTNITDVRTELTSRNLGDVTEEPIYLKFSSPSVPNVTVVDLPGFIRVTKEGEDENLPDIIKNMCQKYIQNPTFIKLIVMAATNDRANSMGLEYVKKAHQFHNAFGVLTKIDLIMKREKSREYLIDMLKEKDYLPGLGLVGVRLRSKEDLDDDISLDDMIGHEDTFLKENKLDIEENINVSIPLLREVLSREQLKRVASSFPQMVGQIDKMIVCEQENRSLLDSLAAQPDLRPISHEVKKLVTILHPLSPRRGDFEGSLQKGLGQLVAKLIEQSIANNIPLEMIKDLDIELNRQVNNGSGSAFEKSAFLNTVRKSYDAIEGRIIDKDDADEFKQLTILGESDPQIDENSLRQITEATFAANTALPFYRLKIPKDFQRRRVLWNENLGLVVEDLLDTNRLGDKCREYCIEQILIFVEKAAEKKESRALDTNTSLAKGFFRYILGQIADRTSKENLVESIRQMVAREKRPYADLTKMTRGIHRVSKLPYDQHVGWLDNEHFPVFVNIYGNIWNHAYVEDNLIPRVQDDVFRIMAVNLLDPLILDTIEQSLKFFQHTDFDQEQREVSKKIDRMNHYISVLNEASITYQPVSDYMEQVKDEKKKSATEKRDWIKRDLEKYVPGQV